MKKFVSKSVKGLSSGVIKWIRDLTKFEKLLLGLVVAPLGLFIVLVVIVIILYITAPIVDAVGKYQLEREKVQLQKRLAELSPQIQETKNKEVQVRLSASEVRALPEFKECVEQSQTPVKPSILKTESLLVEISCERKLGWKTVTKEVRLNCSPFITGEGQPETIPEKEYCQIKNKLLQPYQRWQDGLGDIDLTGAFEWLFKVSLIFGGVFLIVEALKYTIRAALAKNNHA